MSHTQRQSNLELLRIVSMLMVLIVHFDGASLGLPSLDGNISTASGRDWWQLSVESLAIVGVNCFTLISGYFGIRLRLRTVCAYLFQCIFYAVGIYTAVAILSPLPFSWKAWIESWMVITHTDLWYVPAYFGLMLLAPLLNASFNNLSPRQTITATAAFALFNIWAGWGWNAAFNPTGYTICQLIMMYCIGRCIALYHPQTITSSRRKDAILFFAIFLTLSAATTLLATFNVEAAYAYNSPIVIAASASLLIAFARLSLHSATINLIARSSFAVYLIHKAPLIWGNVIRPNMNNLWQNSSLTQYTLAMLAACIAFFIIAMAIDPIRRGISDRIFKKIP